MITCRFLRTPYTSKYHCIDHYPLLKPAWRRSHFTESLKNPQRMSEKNQAKRRCISCCGKKSHIAYNGMEKCQHAHTHLPDSLAYSHRGEQIIQPLLLPILNAARLFGFATAWSYLPYLQRTLLANLLTMDHFAQSSCIVWGAFQHHAVPDDVSVKSTTPCDIPIAWTTENTTLILTSWKLCQGPKSQRITLKFPDTAPYESVTRLLISDVLPIQWRSLEKSFPEVASKLVRVKNDLQHTFCCNWLNLTALDTPAILAESLFRTR